MAFSNIVYLILLINQGNLVFSCDDVLISCFGGQFGYTDADYIPIGLHLAVMEGNSSVEEETFCRTYQQLKTCVRKYIFSCRAMDQIWKTWTATELLHASICSYNNKQKLVLYENCAGEYDVNKEILQCSSQLSWNRSSFAIVAKAELQSKLYPEYIDVYEECMKRIISSKCSDGVTGWLNEHFAASYFAQFCTSIPSTDCADSNVDVRNEIQDCESSYNAGLLHFDLSILCELIESYVKCALDAVARHCGVAQAKAAKPQIIHKRQDMMDLFGCTIGDINIEGSQMTKEVDCMQSKSCEVLLNPFCSSLPYHQVIFPNSLGHQSLEAAQRAMQRDISAIDQEQCGSFFSCFLCSLYFPVCSDLSKPVLPCRQLCESTKQSCGSSWNINIACEILPVDGFCLDSAQCDSHLSQTPTTDQTEMTSTKLLDHEPDKLILIIAVTITIVVIVVVVIIVAVVIRRRNIDTHNAIYGGSELSTARSETNNSSDTSSVASSAQISPYSEIPVDHFLKQNNIG